MAQISWGPIIPTPSFTGQPQALKYTIDHNYLVAGRAFHQGGNDTGFATLVNSVGQVIWEKNYSGDFSTMFMDIDQLKDGNFIAVGIWFTSIYSGDENLWIVKIDAKTGGIIWQKNMGTPGIKTDGYSVAATHDGGFAVTALQLGNNANSEVIKFDNSGNQIWKTGFENKIAMSIIETKDGNLAISGSIPGDNGNSHIFAAKLDNNGNVQWNRDYTSNEVYVFINSYSSIYENADGTFVIVAKSVLMKIDTNGNVIWDHQNTNLTLTSAIELPNKQYAVSGGMIGSDHYTRAYVACLDSDGKAIEWDNTNSLYNSTLAEVVLNGQQEVTAVGAFETNLYLSTFIHEANLFSGVSEAQEAALSEA